MAEIVLAVFVLRDSECQPVIWPHKKVRTTNALDVGPFELG